MEKDMFPIIKDYLLNQEYEVKAEVLDADIVARKDDFVIVIEMKTSFSTRLIYQGLKRQAISDYVYLAIPKPTSKVLRSSSFKEKKTIVRRLELGLILVDTDQFSLDVLLDPKNYQFRRNKKKKRRLLKEFNLRQTSMNVGGVTRTKIVTAYKELALICLDGLRDEAKTTKYLRELTKRKKVTSILQKNYYGWFERVSRGLYQITDLGKRALDDYQDVINQLKE